MSKILIFFLLVLYHALSIASVGALAFFGFMLGAIFSDGVFIYAVFGGALFGGYGIYDYVKKINKGEPFA